MTMSATKQSALTDDLRDVLASAVVEGAQVRLVGELDRKMYLRVNDVLESLGGVWNRKAKAHVFPSDEHAAAVQDAAESGQFIDPKLNGYFPTPSQLAYHLIEMADLAPGQRVLEPSAGQGALAECAAEVVGRDLVVCYEILPDNLAVLRAKGFTVHGEDFLGATPNPVFDAVVMNPPFSNRAYTKHILHAWAFVRLGGVLAAIAPNSLLTATDTATVRLRGLIDANHGMVVHNLDGAFAETGTNVRTVRFAMAKLV